MKSVEEVAERRANEIIYVLVSGDAEWVREMSDSLLYLQASIADHLEEICKLFTQRPKITIVIRTPWLEVDGKEGGVVLTDDDFDEAIAEINRKRDKEPVKP